MQSQVNGLVSAFVENRLRGHGEDNQTKLSSIDSEELECLDLRIERIVAERTSKLRQTLNEFEMVTGAIANDMRGPLRALQALGPALYRDGAPTSSQARTDCAREIITATSRLDKLLQDAIAYDSAVARILPLQLVQVADLVKRLIGRYPEFQPGTADIQVEGSLPAVLGNEILLTQCFCNLLENAVKFVAPGLMPRVRIQSERSSDKARICIKDNGLGIAPHAQQRILDLLQKNNPSPDKTGFGLIIVRRMVERMDGKVGFNSEPGRGSCFWVELKTAGHG